jgi:hypothetical protein
MGGVKKQNKEKYLFKDGYSCFYLTVYGSAFLQQQQQDDGRSELAFRSFP